MDVRFGPLRRLGAKELMLSNYGAREGLLKSILDSKVLAFLRNLQYMYKAQEPKNIK